MNSREKVLKVFGHQEADKVPVDFGGKMVTCMDIEAHKKFKKNLNIRLCLRFWSQYSVGYFDGTTEITSN